MWQDAVVAIVVLVSSLWLIWTLILPHRVKRLLSAGRTVRASAGCNGCALSERGCPSARPPRAREAIRR